MRDRREMPVDISSTLVREGRGVCGDPARPPQRQLPGDNPVPQPREAVAQLQCPAEMVRPARWTSACGGVLHRGELRDQRRTFTGERDRAVAEEPVVGVAGSASCRTAHSMVVCGSDLARHRGRPGDHATPTARQQQCCCPVSGRVLVMAESKHSPPTLDGPDSGVIHRSLGHGPVTTFPLNQRGFEARRWRSSHLNHRRVGGSRYAVARSSLPLLDQRMAGPTTGRRRPDRRRRGSWTSPSRPHPCAFGRTTTSPSQRSAQVVERSSQPRRRTLGRSPARAVSNSAQLFVAERDRGERAVHLLGEGLAARGQAGRLLEVRRDERRHELGLLRATTGRSRSRRASGWRPGRPRPRRPRPPPWRGPTAATLGRSRRPARRRWCRRPGARPRSGRRRSCPARQGGGSPASAGPGRAPRRAPCDLRPASRATQSV